MGVKDIWTMRKVVADYLQLGHRDTSIDREVQDLSAAEVEALYLQVPQEVREVVTAVEETLSGKL